MALQFSASSQTIKPGRFKLEKPVDTSFYFQSYLELNCNKTYVLSDSFIVEFGKWEIDNHKLILRLDSTNRPEFNYHNKERISKALIINGDAITAKIIRRRQYSKVPKIVEQKTGTRPTLENYSDFKKQNKSNPYLRISSFDCE